MKHIFIVILAFSLSINISRAQQTVENVSKELGDVVSAGIKKCKNIPKDSKIAVLFFESSDGLKTTLGMQLSRKTAVNLMNNFNKKDFTIISPENVEEKKLNKISATFFTPPDKESSEDFYKNFNKSQKPDYFLTAKYYVDASFSKLIISEVKIEKNTFDLDERKKSTCGFENVTVNVLESDKNEIINKHTVSLEEICSILANSLKNKTEKVPEVKSKMVRIDNITYGSSRCMSEFSKRFTNDIEQKIANEGLSVSTKQNAPNDPNPVNYNYFLTGNYWEDGTCFKVNISLKECGTEKTLATEEGKVSKQWLTANNISFKPENFEQAKAEDAVFNKDVLPNSGGLNVEVMTNKGNKNLIFTDGEILKLWFKANKECYVRIVYYFADGSKVLMMDNFHVKADSVNKFIDSQKEFYCAEPFGAETLQLFAQSEPFLPLNYQTKDDYKFITDNIETIVDEGRRAFREKKQAAEAKIFITTVRK